MDLMSRRQSFQHRDRREVGIGLLIWSSVIFNLQVYQKVGRDHVGRLLVPS